MKTKNVSINIKKEENVPFKETYFVFYQSKNEIKITQKFIEPKKNQSITLNLKECTRLMNLFSNFLFNGKFQPKKGKMIVFEED